jgi:hypothetical protein
MWGVGKSVIEEILAVGLFCSLAYFVGRSFTKAIKNPGEDNYYSFFTRNGLTAECLVYSILAGFVLLVVKIGFETAAISPVGKHEIVEAVSFLAIVSVATLLALISLWVRMIVSHQKRKWTLQKFASYLLYANVHDCRYCELV